MNTDYGYINVFNDSITYSVLLETPETWLTEQIECDIDMDNVLAKELGSGSYIASYVISNIIIEGIALDQSNNKCDGVQIALKDYQNQIVSDTNIMRNLGYWQLKSSPGHFRVELAYKWSKDNFNIVNGVLFVSSFIWNYKLLRIERIALSIPHRTEEAQDDGKIHIFGVASGKLYERLLKIMMLSVMKNSVNASCKFWLFKNYLSPIFKNTLPVMSKIYGFEYELVTYHWPHWLTRQSEKQRIIWGNKILFLDVLFPLSLKRVIYVDADQIVRTNMRELMEMNFGNAPYAFTPMCGSRLETEPYRFWKLGYWADHLRGKPYHISALFAIDLNRFRESYAGDWLRYYYSSLVKDPASLANLDQDLPNFAQDRIPINTLKQNWLWCETWCHDDEMGVAKTIDLCNNPLTKRPKLEIARTRISEWPGLDEEAQRIEGFIKNDEL